MDTLGMSVHCSEVVPSSEVQYESKKRLQYRSMQYRFVQQKCARNRSATLPNDVTDRSHTVPFRFVSFRTARSRNAAFFRRRKTASLERLSLPSYVFHALGYEESLAKPFLKVGVAPLVLWLARPTISALL